MLSGSGDCRFSSLRMEQHDAFGFEGEDSLMPDRKDQAEQNSESEGKNTARRGKHSKNPESSSVTDKPRLNIAGLGGLIWAISNGSPLLLTNHVNFGNVFRRIACHIFS